MYSSRDVKTIRYFNYSQRESISFVQSLFLLNYLEASGSTWTILPNLAFASGSMRSILVKFVY